MPDWGLSELRELRQLREENGKLKRLVADLSLDRHILQEIVAKSAEASRMRRELPPQRQRPVAGDPGWRSGPERPTSGEADRHARMTLRYEPHRDPQDALRARLRELAGIRVRYGYRRLTRCRLWCPKVTSCSSGFRLYSKVMPPSFESADIQFKAALFDMDGTLVDSTAVVEQEWRSWAMSISVDPQHVIEIAHGRRTEEVISLIAPDLNQGQELSHFLALAAKVDQSGILPVAGAQKFIAAMRPDDWGVVTSAPRAIASARLKLAGFPEPRVLVSADDVRNGKPDPEGYLLGADQLKMSPDDCLVFEDAPAGIKAAVAGKFRVIALATTHLKTQLGIGELYTADTFEDLTIVQDTRTYRAIFTKQ